MCLVSGAPAALRVADCPGPDSGDRPVCVTPGATGWPVSDWGTVTRASAEAERTEQHNPEED